MSEDKTPFARADEERERNLLEDLENHIYNTADFEVCNGQKYYSAKNILDILDKHRRK